MQNEEIQKLNLSGWPLPDEYLTELGRISSIWAAMEALLGMCIGKLAGFDEILDPKPFILVNHASFPQKLDILGSLCEHLKKDYPQLTDHKMVIAKLRTAQKSRNTFLHNTIGPDPESGKMQLAKLSARGKVKTSVVDITIADIRRVTIEIDEANAALYKLVLNKEIGPAWKRINA